MTEEPKISKEKAMKEYHEHGALCTKYAGKRRVQLSQQAIHMINIKHDKAGMTLEPNLEDLEVVPRKKAKRSECKINEKTMKRHLIMDEDSD